MLRRNPYRTPNKTPRKNYKQTKIVKFMKTEDEIFMENNVWNKMKEEVEFPKDGKSPLELRKQPLLWPKKTKLPSSICI